MANLVVQLHNSRLTTAQILYHLPDHPLLLQSFLWQEYDLAPDFPRLRRFLDFWTREIEGRLHSVCVSSRLLITPGDVSFYQFEYLLH
ncbi:MAG: Usg family protein [Proteobacteria bacterium]|nr:Usg family protein [Pseudomonadota bacterium]